MRWVVAVVVLVAIEAQAQDCVKMGNTCSRSTPAPSVVGDPNFVGGWHLNDNFVTGGIATDLSPATNPLTTDDPRTNEFAHTFEGHHAVRSSDDGFRLACLENPDCTDADFDFGGGTGDFTCYGWVTPDVGDEDPRIIMGNTGSVSFGGWQVRRTSGGAAYQFRAGINLGPIVALSSTTPATAGVAAAFIVERSGAVFRITMNGHDWEAVGNLAGDISVSEDVSPALVRFVIGRPFLGTAMHGIYDFFGCWRGAMTLAWARKILVCGEDGRGCRCATCPNDTEYVIRPRHETAGGLITGELPPCSDSTVDYEGTTPTTSTTSTSSSSTTSTSTTSTTATTASTTTSTSSTTTTSTSSTSTSSTTTTSTSTTSSTVVTTTSTSTSVTTTTSTSSTSTSTTTTTSTSTTSTSTSTTTTSTSSTTSTTAAEFASDWSGNTYLVAHWKMDESFGTNTTMVDVTGNHSLGVSGTNSTTSSNVFDGSGLSYSSGQYQCDINTTCAISTNIDDFDFGACNGGTNAGASCQVNGDCDSNDCTLGKGNFTVYGWMYQNDAYGGEAPMFGSNLSIFGGWAIRRISTGYRLGAQVNGGSFFTADSTTGSAQNTGAMVIGERNGGGLRISVNGGTTGTPWEDTDSGLGTGDITNTVSGPNFTLFRGFGGYEGPRDFTGVWRRALAMTSIRKILVCGIDGTGCTCSGASYTSCPRHTADGDGCGDSAGIIAGTMDACNAASPTFDD